MTVLRLEALQKSFGGLSVIDNVTLDVAAKAFLQSLEAQHNHGRRPAGLRLQPAAI